MLATGPGWPRTVGDDAVNMNKTGGGGGLNAGRLIILRAASRLEGREAQNECHGAGAAKQQQLRRISSCVAVAL